MYNIGQNIEQETAHMTEIITHEPIDRKGTPAEDTNTSTLLGTSQTTICNQIVTDGIL